MKKRQFLTGSLSLLGLASCGRGTETPPSEQSDANQGPAIIQLRVSGQAGMNPGPDGSDRPVTIQIAQLRSTGLLQSADPFTLQDPTSSLAADLVQLDQLAVAPGANASKEIIVSPSAQYVALIAGFREPIGRNTYVIHPSSVEQISLVIDSSGVRTA